jgi:thiol:disulfide interchange protein
MSSWSENRSTISSAAVSKAINEKRRLLEQVNSVLHQVSQDDDFYDDLKMPIVLKALNHWTGKNRLQPEQAMELQENRRVMYVFKRFQTLASVCQAAGIQVPLNLLIEKKLLNIDSYLESDLNLLKEVQKREKEAQQNSTEGSSEEISNVKKDIIPSEPVEKTKTTAQNEQEETQEKRSNSSNNINNGSVDKEKNNQKKNQTIKNSENHSSSSTEQQPNEEKDEIPPTPFHEPYSREKDNNVATNNNKTEEAKKNKNDNESGVNVSFVFLFGILLVVLYFLYQRMSN